MSNPECSQTYDCHCDECCGVVELKAQLKLAIEALGHYANRMDSGGTARKALEQIKKE